MKKLVLFGLIIIAFVLIFINKDTLIYNYHTSSFEEISANEFYELVEGEEEAYFVYFGRSTCPYCRDFVDDLSTAAKESDTFIHYIDTENTAMEPELRTLRDQVGVEFVPSLVKIDTEQHRVELLDITHRQMEDLLLHFQ